MLDGGTMKTTLVLLFVFGLSLARAQDVPAGRLGHPLGTYLRIEGIRIEGPKYAGRTLLVDALNGKKLETPIDIAIENVDSLPKDTRCILRGYEMGQMVGTPPAVEQAAKEEGKDISQPQAGWKFYRYFIVTSVVEPKDLKKK
jgi:hypothetical protein